MPGADFTFWEVLGWNIIPAALGNWIGGVGFVGFITWCLWEPKVQRWRLQFEEEDIEGGAANTPMDEDARLETADYDATPSAATQPGEQPGGEQDESKNEPGAAGTGHDGARVREVELAQQESNV